MDTPTFAGVLSENATGQLAAFLTACLWTGSSIYFERAARKLGSLTLNLIRLVFAVVMLGTVNTFTTGSPIPLHATPHEWLWLSLSGLVGFVFGDYCLFQAYLVIGARLTLLLQTLAPPFAALLGVIFLRDELAPLDLVGIAVTLGGVAWVVSERAPAIDGSTARIPTWGVVLAIGAALGQAIGLILGKHGMGLGMNPVVATQMRAMAATVGFATLFTLIGHWPKVAASLRHRAGFGDAALGAFFGPFLGVSFSLYAIQHTSTGVAATLMALTPVLIIPLAWKLNGERITPRIVLGAIISVAGVALLVI